MIYHSIAIDGPAGAGKSSLSRQLAARLGYIYVDTGALYRTVGLYVSRTGGHCSDAKEVIDRLPKIQIKLEYQDGLQQVILNGEVVTDAIRENHVSMYASQVSAIPEVRHFLLDMQRKTAEDSNIVMDGRDIGTVVLPNADVKVFLTASPEKRAERRCAELEKKGRAISMDVVLKEIIERDRADMERSVAPLRRADDAMLLDTSDLNFEESLQALENMVTERLKNGDTV